MRRLSLSILAVGLFVAACAHRGPAVPPRQKVEFIPVSDSEAAGVTNPHDYKGGTLCQRCHVAGEQALGLDPISLCSQCHDVGLMRHPFRVEQLEGAGPLPLMEGQTVACHTCHDPHDVKKHPHGLRDQYTKLCLNCHKRH